MAKCVEKLNRLASTIKTQQYTSEYKLGKTNVMKMSQAMNALQVMDRYRK